MKRALLLLTLAAASCGNVGGPVSADVAWSIQINGIVASCAQADADTVSFDFRRVATGQTLTYDFPCNAGGGTTTPDLVQDDYDITVTLWRAFGTANQASLASRTFAAFLTGRVSIIPEAVFALNADVLVSFRASWTILDEQSDPITCASVPAETVTFDFTNRRTGNPDQFIFTCDQGLGVFVTSTPDLVEGDMYDATVTLWFHFELADQQVVGTQDFVVTSTTGTIQFPNIVFALQ